MHKYKYRHGHRGNQIKQIYQMHSFLVSLILNDLSTDQVHCFFAKEGIVTEEGTRVDSLRPISWSSESHLLAIEIVWAGVQVPRLHRDSSELNRGRQGSRKLGQESTGDSYLFLVFQTKLNGDCAWFWSIRGFSCVSNWLAHKHEPRGCKLGLQRVGALKFRYWQIWARN